MTTHPTRTMRRGRFAMTGIHFDPNDDRGGNGDDDEKDGDKKFSQDDVDRIVRERLARDRKDRPSDEEIAQLREKAQKYDEAEQQSKTDLEKEREAREKAERDAEAARNEAKETRLTAAILAEAAKADRKVVDPDAVLSLIDKKSLTLDDSGNPTNIAEAMDALLEARPYLVSAGGTTRTKGAADQGPRGGDGEGQLKSTDGMSADEIAKAVAEGRLDDYLKSS